MNTVPVLSWRLNGIVSAAALVDLNQWIVGVNLVAVFEAIEGIVPATLAVKLNTLVEIIATFQFCLPFVLPIAIEDLVDVQWFEAALYAHQIELPDLMAVLRANQFHGRF